MSGACTTHAALPISCGWQPTRHHRVPALLEASAHAVQLNPARGPSWRARVRPAEALGRACQRESRSEGPLTAPAPEDRPCHPCFAARKTCFYPAHTGKSFTHTDRYKENLGSKSLVCGAEISDIDILTISHLSVKGPERA